MLYFFPSSSLLQSRITLYLYIIAIVWNRITGEPYHNAIVWNDVRTSELCEELCNRPASNVEGLGSGLDRYRARTGLPIANYFSAAKLLHLLRTVSGLREAAEKGGLSFLFSAILP